MKPNIHPEIFNVTAQCASCNYSFRTTSTKPELKTTLCSKCHPFFTNEQRWVDTAGRIDKFKKKYTK